MNAAGNPVTCPSCGHSIEEHFCTNCGEKRTDLHDFSMKHLAAESIEGLTHFDNKFFRSLKLLITKPGLLTQYHFAGRRVPYMKPVQLFIVCNIIFFLLLGKLNVFSLNFYNYINFSPYTRFGTQKAVAAKAVTEDALTQLAIQFNDHIGGQSKAFLILFIPVIAIGAALFFINKRKYFAEHLVFVTHYFTFLVLFYIAQYFLLVLPFSWFNKIDSNRFDLVVSMLGLLVLAVYFAIAAKRFYAISRVKAVLSALFIVLLFTFALYAYRMFLFYKILYTL